MRPLPYAQSLFHLISSPRLFAKEVITSFEDGREISKWSFSGKHLFFDIDDTLGVHKGGLNADICKELNQLISAGKTVHLITNCSQGRAEEHRSKLREHDCHAEFWQHGLKPDFQWLLGELTTKSMSPSECSFYGDRPTMDLWMAWKAGFGHRVWIRGWRELSSQRTGFLRWIQDLEWTLLEPHLHRTD